MFSSPSSKKYKILTTLSLAALILILGVTPVLAGGATVMQVDVSYLGPTPNHPCTGGTLAASGMITIVAHPTGNGYFMHIGPGKGGVSMVDVDTGEFYRFVGGLNNHSVSAGGGTYVHHLNWISPGSGVNFVGQILEHVTITPNGDIAVSFDWANFQCK